MLKVAEAVGFGVSVRVTVGDGMIAMVAVGETVFIMVAVPVGNTAYGEQETKKTRSEKESMVRIQNFLSRLTSVYVATV